MDGGRRSVALDISAAPHDFLLSEAREIAAELARAESTLAELDSERDHLRTRTARLRAELALASLPTPSAITVTAAPQLAAAPSASHDDVDGDVPVLAKMFAKRLRGYRALGSSARVRMIRR